MMSPFADSLAVPDRCRLPSSIAEPCNSANNHLPANLVAAAYMAVGLLFTAAVRFDQVSELVGALTRGPMVVQCYASLIVTWTGGSYDTTMGFRHFAPDTWVFAGAFALAGLGVHQRRIWGYRLAIALAAVGALEPALRLSLIRLLMPYSDSLGYLLDIQQIHLAMLVASLPSAMAILWLLSPSGRRTFALPRAAGPQFSLSTLGTLVAVLAVLLNHAIELSKVYGTF